MPFFFFGVPWALGSLVFYRIALHPFRNYPGPFLSKICGLPTLYHAWKGDLHYHLYHLHCKYVRYSPNKLSINDGQALNDIYGFNKNCEKPEKFYSAFRVNKHAINTFNTSSKEDHRRKRRIMAKGFSDWALATYHDAISEPVTALATKLGASGLSPEWRAFNWAHEANCLMLDIMGRLCFGAAFGFIDGKGDQLLPDFHRRALRIYMTAHEPLLKELYVDRILFPQLFTANTVLADYARSYTMQRVNKYRAVEGVQEVAAHQDILSHLLDARDEETNSVYSDNELLGEAILLLMAGSDTTSTTLTSTIFYLVHHQSVLGKLRAELYDTFKCASDIDVLAAENCKYLRACIDEAMRLCPPSPTNIPRRVGQGSMKICESFYPEGVYVGVPNFSLFRNEEYFKQPHAYLPERWIVDSSTGVDEEQVNLSRSVFKPFSLGPRHCIAQRLALKEVTYVIAKLVYLLDFRIVGDSGKLARDTLPGVGSHLVLEQIDVFTSLENGPMIEWRQRLKE
ncbi:hypothetical protein UA08_05969 [Talaromyces atroroseus]|uniref:Isotrichodermin C-15 hydroxylase n=1 Tax=Talaromyces atroroseus TaxID=1441469 RepID=A0A225AZV1_TALAT|nr:hypothetical protein UA08_05969 [Talaromyces atroroseus]OKL59057.1 hypothetical protein UA08_05969 [Talaromyces atroroseus]